METNIEPFREAPAEERVSIIDRVYASNLARARVISATNASAGAWVLRRVNDTAVGESLPVCLARAARDGLKLGGGIAAHTKGTYGVGLLTLVDIRLLEIAGIHTLITDDEPALAYASGRTSLKMVYLP